MEKFNSFFNKFKNLNNQFGMGLMQVTLAAGVVSVALLGSFKMMERISNNQSKLIASLDINDAIKMIALRLSDKIACKNTLMNFPPNSGPSAITSIKTRENLPIFSLNKPIGNIHAVLNRLETKNIDVPQGGGNGTIKLEIEFKKSREGKTQGNFVLPFTLNAKVSSTTGLIENCYHDIGNVVKSAKTKIGPLITKKNQELLDKINELEIRIDNLKRNRNTPLIDPLK
jgi:hypothetical protein